MALSLLYTVPNNLTSLIDVIKMINQKSENLPEPDPEASAHSKKLCNYINQKIASAKSAIPFAEFMELALYTPGLGYYSAGAHKIGRAGDFITAPELSPLFSYCLANQCAQILPNLINGNILELGAGSGKMAGDILSHLEKINCLPNHYYILEISADLKARQQAFIKQAYPHFLSKIIWLDTLPNNFIGIILANEVLDAMPVTIFNWQENTLAEYYVGIDQNNHYTWLLKPASNALQDAFKEITNEININSWFLPYNSEINLLLPGWLSSLNHCLEQGILLLIDYGFPLHEYYHPQRNQGTLMCHYQHRAHSNPLILVGLQDITSHVNFTAVTQFAIQAGLGLEGYVSQANFLFNTGLLELIKTYQEPDSLNFNSAIKILTLPSEMGELFKVIGFSKN
ncbi:MAG: hypothetical protein A2Z57_13095, partial [Planctomycetes bacterium RIFCSPHIGHO2_12_39_6]